MTRYWKSGFTLLELLTVQALIVLLAAILFPTISAVRDTARRARCLSNLRQIVLAHQLYVQDYDEVLPSWQLDPPSGPILWTEFMRPYFRDTRILDEGLTTAKEKREFIWLADYALCAWGPSGKGTREKPYWLWPGALRRGPDGPRAMHRAEVRRPSETLQFTDGLTLRYNPRMTNSLIRRRHRNGRLNGVFLDGHARTISEQQWGRIEQDERGYFYAIAAADR